MSTSLGWRDVGSVLLSKADAERTRGDSLRGDGSRDTPVFQGAVMSRRQRPKSRGVDEEVERNREAAASLTSDRDEVLSKKPELRLKWLMKALILAAKKSIKVDVIYDVVTHRKFVEGVRDVTGAKMRAMLLANLHVFSSKQQKWFLSASNSFSSFADVPTKEPSRKKARKAASSSSSERCSRSPGGDRGRGGAEASRGGDRQRRSRSRSRGRQPEPPSRGRQLDFGRGDRESSGHRSRSRGRGGGRRGGAGRSPSREDDAPSDRRMFARGAADDEF
mmetsp:Transcript_25363/g.55197  ORF Transcript_25363/g.55197 Transcript_25363/m.55197 type:complete len:277 (+) Transcript_25363:29-859(+)